MSRSFESQLADLRARSLQRRLREMGTAQGTEIELRGERLVNFSSNDYLGLAGDPVLKEAAKAAIDLHGVGAGASRLVSGTFPPHGSLERKLASFKRTDSALTFSSGYAAAVGTITALAGREDVVILDKLAHASLVDGARLSGAQVRVFPHNHMGKLESRLRWARENFPDARLLVVTESVFSMDGDRAPLEEMVPVVKKFDAILMVDEAHGVGVVGTNGRGVADLLGVTDKIDVQMGTMSKALGVCGGYVCGKRSLIELLVHRARSFIYSTAPPPALAATAEAALDFLCSAAGEERRKTLWRNIELLHAGLPDRLRPAAVESAIVPIILGAEERAMRASARLRECGFFVPAIRYPTVARGSARLRVTLSASHSPEQIGALASQLSRIRPLKAEPAT